MLIGGRSVPIRPLQVRYYDISLRCVADEIEGEACDERQGRQGCGIQDRNIFRRNNSYFTDRIRIGLARTKKFNDIALRDALQPSKETVPVPRDAQVARFANLGRPENSSHPTIEGEVIRIVENGHFEADLGNPKNRQRSIRFLRQTILVRRDPLGRPQPKINWRAQDGMPRRAGDNETRRVSSFESSNGCSTTDGRMQAARNPNR